MALTETNYNNKTILVTGATGFIGQNLCPQLSHLGAKVIGTSRSPAPQSSHLVQLDLSDKQATQSLINDIQPHYIFHLAAQKSRNSSIDALDSALQDNLIGSLNLFSANANNTNIETIVSLGTIDEYGRSLAEGAPEQRLQPISPYGVSKYCVSILADMMTREYNIPITTIRPSLAYGPHQDVDMFIPALIKSILAGKKFSMTAGDQTRDFIYIDDLINGIIIAGAHKNFVGKSLNIGSKGSIKLKDVVAIITDQLKASHLVDLGAVPYRNGEIMNYQVDSSILLSNTSWKPLTSIKDGLKKTINFYKKLNDA